MARRNRRKTIFINQKTAIVGFSLGVLLICGTMTKGVVSYLHRTHTPTSEVNKGGDLRQILSDLEKTGKQIVATITHKPSTLERTREKLRKAAAEREEIKEEIDRAWEKSYQKKWHKYEKARIEALKDKTGVKKIPPKPLRHEEIYRRDAKDAFLKAYKAGRWQTLETICKALHYSPIVAGTVGVQESSLFADKSISVHGGTGAFQHLPAVARERLSVLGGKALQLASNLKSEVNDFDASFRYNLGTLRPFIQVAFNKGVNSPEMDKAVEDYKKVLAEETKGQDQSWRKKSNKEIKTDLLDRAQSLLLNFAYSTTLYVLESQNKPMNAENTFGSLVAQAMKAEGLDFAELFPDADHYRHVWGRGGVDALETACLLAPQKTTMLEALTVAYKGNKARALEALTGNKADPDQSVGAYFYAESVKWHEQCAVIAGANEMLEKRNAPFRLVTKDATGLVKQAQAAQPAPGS